MIKPILYKNLEKFEQEKLQNLLECSDSELNQLFEKAETVFSDTATIYDALLSILQQGNNIREATLIGVLCGKLIGFADAEEKIEEEIKEKLFNSFKRNSSLR